MSDTADTTETVASWNAKAAQELAPGQLLRQAKQLLDEAEKLVEEAVIAERAKDTSWETIGDVLDGVTKSAAQKRFGKQVSLWSVQSDTVLGIDKAVKAGSSKAEAAFSLAYEQLRDRWRGAGEIVAKQDLIAQLTNATTAVSGAHTGDALPDPWLTLEPLFLYANSDRVDTSKFPPWVHVAEDAAECRAMRLHHTALAAALHAKHSGRRQTAYEPQPLQEWAADAHSPTLEDRVTRLERAFQALLARSPEEPPADGSTVPSDET